MIKTVKYGQVDLNIRDNELAFTLREANLVRHYPGTDRSSISPLGKMATEIRLTAIIRSEAAKLALEQVLHDSSKRTFQHGSRFYKDVVPAGAAEFRTLDLNKEIYVAVVTLMALDPVPYSMTTQEALY